MVVNWSSVNRTSWLTKNLSPGELSLFVQWCLVNKTGNSQSFNQTWTGLLFGIGNSSMLVQFPAFRSASFQAAKRLLGLAKIKIFFFCLINLLFATAANHLAAIIYWNTKPLALALAISWSSNSFFATSLFRFSFFVFKSQNRIVCLLVSTPTGTRHGSLLPTFQV